MMKKRIIAFLLTAITSLSVSSVLTSIPTYAITTGWNQEDSIWYYYKNGTKVKNDWIKYNSNWYYVNADGKMVTDWNYINGKWYYFDYSGQMYFDIVMGDYSIDMNGALKVTDNIVTPDKAKQIAKDYFVNKDNLDSNMVALNIPYFDTVKGTFLFDAFMYTDSTKTNVGSCIDSCVVHSNGTISRY